MAEVPFDLFGGVPDAQPVSSTRADVCIDAILDGSLGNHLSAGSCSS